MDILFMEYFRRLKFYYINKYKRPPLFVRVNWKYLDEHPYFVIFDQVRKILFYLKRHMSVKNRHNNCRKCNTLQKYTKEKQ